MRKFDDAYHYHSQSFLTVPMQDHEGEVLGVLQLINAKDRESGATRAFSETDQRFIEALASQAAIALTNQQLIKQHGGAVRILRQADQHRHRRKIAAHRARHCEHVPLLTMMLAERGACNG